MLESILYQWLIPFNFIAWAAFYCQSTNQEVMDSSEMILNNERIFPRELYQVKRTWWSFNRLFHCCCCRNRRQEDPLDIYEKVKIKKIFFMFKNFFKGI